MTVDAADAPGRRERKKQRTRDALARAALELFTTKGFEATTVDEIAEAVDVSQRTFYRYYPAKEDVAFAVQAISEDHFVEALRARPAHEAPFEAMRNAMLAAWDTIEEAVGEVVPVELHMRTYQVIESTPALLAVRIRRSLETEEKIARILAAREGLDLDTDPRPRIAVAAFGSAMQVADRIWNARGDHSREAIRAIAADCLDQLRPAVAESWRT